MKHIKSNWKWLVPMIILALVGGLLSMNAGEVTAANTSADNNFKTRYSTDVTITALEEGVPTGTGSSGQVVVHDGTDGEWKTVTASGAASGTLASTGALVLTQNVNTVGTNNIINNTVSSADILNATITSTDIATNTVSSANILNATIADADIAVNAVTATKILTNTVTLVSVGQGNVVAVESGSVLLAVHPISGFSNDVTLTKAVIDGSSNLIINTDDSGAATTIINALMWRPSQ
jgi:hypothetical protein